MFAFYGTHDLGLMLKSYKAQTVNGKSTVTIICETNDPYHLGFALRELAETAEAQKKSAAAARAAAKAAARPAKKPRTPMLALPAPQLALPKPEGK